MNIKKIKIGGHVVDIHSFDNFGSLSDEIGLCSPAKNSIKISRSYIGNKLHEQTILESLLHEVLHFIDYVYCGYVLEEVVIKNLAKYLLYIFNKNNIFNFPDTIDFMGYEYEINYDFSFTETTKPIAIDVNRITQTITMGPDMVDGEFNCDGYKVTRLILGVLNVINGEYIEDDDLTDNVSTFAQGLYQVLIDNKTFYNMFKWGK